MPASLLPQVPADFDRAQDTAWSLVKGTPGYLSEREARFLMLAAACTPAKGAILEIGSFKGRSTVALAYMAKHYKLGRVIAVDPHTSPCSTDPDLRGQSTSYDDFIANLERAGVRAVVEPQRVFSNEHAPHHDTPLRVLWIDGDHTTEGARTDLRLFKPHLVPGAIVAMHDVLGTWEGSLRVFCEDILDSDDFGPAGFCGSIGWAQYLPKEGKSYRFARWRLATPAKRLIPIAASGRGLVGFNKLWYKLWRALAPHGSVSPDNWVKKIRTA